MQDGAFFLPQESRDSHTGVARLCALVVAPGLDSSTVVQQLRQRIDAVFLPRPLRLVAALPEADLRTPGRFPWLDGEPLWMVLYWSFEHVHEHIYHLAVQAWRALPQ